MLGTGLTTSGFDELDLEADRDVFPDQHAAGFERGVPSQAEVLAIDLGRGGKADAQIPPRVFGGLADAFDGEGDGLGDAVQREVAGDLVIALARRLDLGGFEGQGRMLSASKKSALLRCPSR